MPHTTSGAFFLCGFLQAFQLRRQRNIWTDARQVKSWQKKLLLTCRQRRGANWRASVCLHLLHAPPGWNSVLSCEFSLHSRHSCVAGINFSLFLPMPMEYASAPVAHVWSCSTWGDLICFFQWKMKIIRWHLFLLSATGTKIICFGPQDFPIKNLDAFQAHQIPLMCQNY